MLCSCVVSVHKCNFFFDIMLCLYVTHRLAMQELGKITGRVDVEELLDIIFRDFCIGK